MGLISKTAVTKWNARNKKWYEEKKYVYTKMGDEFEVKVEDLMDGCKSLVDVKCDCEDCETPINKPVKWGDYKKCVHDGGKYYCVRCVKNIFSKYKCGKTKLEKGTSFSYWCFKHLPLKETVRIIARWDYDKNKCNINEVLFTSSGENRKGFWFKCLDHPGHGSELKSIGVFVNHYNKSKQCNVLSCNKCNSFAQWGIDNLGEDFLEKYWDYEKNTVNPWNITRNYGKKVWIKCHKSNYHESYDTTCGNFVTANNRCPYCVGRKTHPLDSLGQYIVDRFGEDFLNLIWSEKNKKTAFEYSPYSTKKVWWKCENNRHEDYFRIISGSNVYDFRCPDCVNERDESFLQEKVRMYLETLGYTLLHEYKCTIVPKNPKTNYLLPFDNELKEICLIVESHGKQHYKMDSFHTLQSKHNNTTPEYELHYQKLKDRYKRIYAKMNGYHYLEIPFWTDNNTEEWKTLIDNKIQEILSQQTKSA